MASEIPWNLLLALVGGILYLMIFTGHRGRNLPPGPPTLPLIGNLHQIPTKGAHFKFTQWARQYGGIFSLKLGSATAVVITDRGLVKATIDKKSSIYSDRPTSYIAHDLMTKGDHLLVMRHGEKWRIFRKLIHQHFNESRCEKEHVLLQNAEAVQMLRDFCIVPQNAMQHPKRFSNSIIMANLFGIRSSTVNAQHLVDLFTMMEEWSKVMETGATPPVDIFPIFKYLPDGLWNHWYSRSKAVGASMDALYFRMVSRVMQRRLVTGNRGSFLDNVLDQQEKLQLSRNELNFLVGVLMEGGSDTSSSIIIAFLQAMVKYPEVQEKAQKEIDTVIGDERSPIWSDYDHLPYISMIVKESMRWRPVTPLAFPHALSDDDEINDMRIPKSTIVILNVWGLHHDPNTTAHPSEFIPERFEGRHLLAPEYARGADYMLRDHYGYGSGRRICPGMALAERNLWLAMAKLLWAFDMKYDGDGALDVDPRTAYSEGFLVCAKPFPMKIEPRSKEKVSTIMREFDAVDKDIFSKYEAE